MGNTGYWLPFALMTVVLILYIFWAGKRQRQWNEAARLNLEAAKENSAALKAATEALNNLREQLAKQASK